MAGQRDALVNTIGKAISTGKKTTTTASTRNNVFYAGRVSAFIYSAAIIADQCFARDFDEARKRIRQLVEDVHSTASDDNLREQAWVGSQADRIATAVLELGA